MKRTLLLSTVAAFIGLTAMPSLADDRGAQDQILKGANPKERDVLQAPHHFNDRASPGGQLAQGPIEPGQSDFGIIAPNERGVFESMTDDRGRRPGRGSAVGIAAPWERESYGRQLANGLVVD